MSERTKDIRVAVIKLAAVLAELLVLTKPSSGCHLLRGLNVRHDRPKLVLIKPSKDSDSLPEE